MGVFRDGNAPDAEQDAMAAYQPRAVIAFVSDARWAVVEFITMLHSSWRYVTALPGAARYKLDLLAFAHPSAADQLPALCEPLNPGEGWDANGPDRHPAIQPDVSQCLLVEYPPPTAAQWFNYPFINNVHFLADPAVAALLLRHYVMAIKTDADVFLTPALLHWFPEEFTFGVQEYVVLQSTSRRLHQVAAALGLRPPAQHNLGPTWYGRVPALLGLAAASIPIMRHLITQEWDAAHILQQRWFTGEGWPEWSGGLAALYATELAANHEMVGGFATTSKMDEHADSLGLIGGTYVLHCRHGDGDFSKPRFLSTHYDEMDLAKLDLCVNRDYATFLAVGKWRQMVEAGIIPDVRPLPAWSSRGGPAHDEL